MERSGIQIVFVDVGKNKLTTVARLPDLDISGDGVIPISVICGYRLYNAYYKYSILLLRVTSIQVVVVHLMYPYTTVPCTTVLYQQTPHAHHLNSTFGIVRTTLYRHSTTASTTVVQCILLPLY